MEIYENRSYVICHILSALDGNISGEYFMMPELEEVQEAFARIRTEYDCDAFLAGAVTAAAIYADGFLDETKRTKLEAEQQTMAANAAASGEERPAHTEASQRKFRETFVADAHARHYAVIIDTEGTLRWTKGHMKRAGMPEMHMIEVLTENVPDSYLDMLQKAGVSYLFAGEETLDMEILLKKLKQEFGIDSLMVTGGGVVDWSFLQAGVMDELSLILCPLASGETDKATVFDRSGYMTENVPVAFALLDVQKVEGGGIWLRYAPNNRRR